MELTFGAWIVAAGVALSAAYVLLTMFRVRPSAEFDAGTVSQSWLTEHRTGKNTDRFS